MFSKLTLFDFQPRALQNPEIKEQFHVDYCQRLNDLASRAKAHNKMLVIQYWSFGLTRNINNNGMSERMQQRLRDNNELTEPANTFLREISENVPLWIKYENNNTKRFREIRYSSVNLPFIIEPDHDPLNAAHLQRKSYEVIKTNLLYTLEKAFLFEDCKNI